MDNLIVTDGRRTSTAITSEQALAKGYSPKQVADAEIAVLRRSVGGECRRRIYVNASAETQMNMAAASSLISSKSESARTIEEKAVLVGLAAAIAWVGQMRAAVAVILTSGVDNFQADEHWPELPAEAAAVLGQF